jgi:hypothetical protein
MAIKHVWVFALFLLNLCLPALSYSQQSGSEITLAQGTGISLQLNDHLSTKNNSEGDPFSAIVIKPVYQGEHLIIPKGSTITGSISRIVRPGRFGGKATMNLLFYSISVPGRGVLPLTASLVKIDSAGDGSVGNEGAVEQKSSRTGDVGRVLGPTAAGGAIGGGIGGGKGAGIGAGVGAAVGLGSIFMTRGKDLEMRKGATMEISLDRPLPVPLEGDEEASRAR